MKRQTHANFCSFIFHLKKDECISKNENEALQ